MKINISMNEETLVGILHAVSQSSCGYALSFDDKPIPISLLHCCDYNEPVRQILDQTPDKFLKDEDNIAYLKILKEELNINKAKGLIKEEKGMNIDGARQWYQVDEHTRDQYMMWGEQVSRLEQGEFVFLDKYGNLLKAKHKDVTLSVEKSKAWDEFCGYFDSVVTEDGNVYDGDDNIVTIIQNIRMNYQFEEESE